MTASSTSSPPFAFNYRSPAKTSGLRNSPPPSLPSYWVPSSIAPFDFSPDSDLSSQTTRSTEKPWTFKSFIPEAWTIIEPGTPFIGGYHVDAIAEHLQAISDGDLQNLIINIPPRHTKSSLVSVLWPAWEWTVSPHLQWLFASYREALAIRDSVKMRRLIQSPWYQERWGSLYRLTGDQNEKRRFENDRNGHRIAIGVGTGTGEGGHRLVCLGYNSPITTSAGRLPIGQIVERKMPVKVLTFDHETGRPCWSGIDAYESGPGRPSVRLRFSDGSTLDATDDHPVYVEGRGYVEAAQVSAGERVVTDRAAMLDLWQGRAPLAVTYGAARRSAGILQSHLSRDRADWRRQPDVSGRTRYATLPSVRGAERSKAIAGERHDARQLQPCVSASVSQSSQSEAGSASGRVRVLWGRDRDTPLASRTPELLLANVLESGALGSHEGDRQRPIPSWSCRESVPSGVPSDQTRDQAPRWESLPGLLNDDGGARLGVAGASHRLRPYAQRSVEPDNTLQVVSWANARTANEPSGMAATTVVSVERIQQPDRVYNLQVAQHHNYFASGILVHNCDDPLSADQAESDAYRESANDWVDGTFSTRGNDPRTVARVIVMQRLHEQDTTGHLLEKAQAGGHVYDHLILPAEYEPTVQFCVADLQHDPRTEAGELLSPDRFGPKELSQLKASLGEMGTAGQLQQRPAPAGGAVFKREWWETDTTRYHIETPVMVDARWLSLDTAFKDGEENDFTACLCLELLTDGRFRVREVWREKLTFPQLVPTIVSAATRWNQDGKLQAVAVEDKGSGQSAVQVLRSSAPDWLARRVVATPGKHSKTYRARAASLWCAQGLLLLPHPSAEVPWLWSFEEELYKFPTAAHDDQVDAFSQIIIELDAYFRRSQRARQTKAEAA